MYKYAIRFVYKTKGLQGGCKDRKIEGNRLASRLSYEII